MNFRNIKNIKNLIKIADTGKDVIDVDVEEFPESLQNVVNKNLDAEIDNGILDIIYKLNEKGYPTLVSCSGLNEDHLDKPKDEMGQPYVGIDARELEEEDIVAMERLVANLDHFFTVRDYLFSKPALIVRYWEESRNQELLKNSWLAFSYEIESL